jgi:hypothetical protein
MVRNFIRTLIIPFRKSKLNYEFIQNFFSISLFQKSIRDLENVEDFEKGNIHTETISFLTSENFKKL